MLRIRSWFGARGAIIAIVAVLAGCESKISVDLSVYGPADPQINAVFVELDGVQFRKDSGEVETLQFDSPQSYNLMVYPSSNALRLFTDEQLSDGRYTGVRLLYGNDKDKTNEVQTFSGDEVPLAVSGTAPFSEVDFKVDKDNSSDDGIHLTLDLRQSLAFADNLEAAVLEPIVRAIRIEDAGGVAGNVAVACPANSSLAIYLFPGEVTPDDRDNAEPQPYLTTGVGTGGSSTLSGYSFPYLPEGTYTLASTCRGDEETPLGNEDLNFNNAARVEVKADSSVTRNVP